MSMNIQPRQMWRTRGGETVYTSARVSTPWCWPVCTDRGGFGNCWRVTDEGLYSLDGPHANDLLEFMGVLPEEPDTDTKASNPKEAIGDKKVPLWLCSTIAMAHWAAAQVAGYVKYGAWNWRVAGVRASTYIAAIQRHLGRWTNGERLDPVDGTHHLGNIMACCAILLEAEALGKLTDDRPPKADAALAKALEEVEQICARLKVQYADKTPKHWTIEDTLP